MKERPMTELRLQYDSSLVHYGKDMLPYYTPSSLRTSTEQEMRKEYTRLRDIAMKRVNRLNNGMWSGSEVAQQYKNGFATLKEIADNGTDGKTIEAKLRQNLAHVSQFLNAKSSTAYDQEILLAKRIEGIEASGYGDILPKGKSAQIAFFHLLSKIQTEYSQNLFYLIARTDSHPHLVEMVVNNGELEKAAKKAGIEELINRIKQEVAEKQVRQKKPRKRKKK